jgi:hypothetical protein
MSCPSHPWFDHPYNICEAYTLWSSLLCSLLQHGDSSLLGLNNLFSPPCSQTPSVNAPPFVWEIMFHSYKTAAKIIGGRQKTEHNSSKHYLNLICSKFLHKCS